LANVVCDVNSLQKDGFIEVEGKKLKLEFFLGGDYKVQLKLTQFEILLECYWNEITEMDLH